ncbi:hypothetical protein [Enterococcus sp. AZ196]|uniref:hypothetical protein n=1 Tax=Enterococcus sp. AZ196 TaxID=2774659 RepID=UPI003D286072
MKTKRQKELIDSFLLTLDTETGALYREIVVYLSELGYNPKKERAHISFKHDLHNKQIAKIGIKSKNSSPFFALRFSACQDYSQKLAEAVRAAIIKSPSKTPGCVHKNCDYCAGDPETHIYTFPFPDKETKAHCGAYALEIPGIVAEDLVEIKQLIKKEHDYLLKYELDT